MVFFQGMRIRVAPVDEEQKLHRTVTEIERGFWDAEDGELVLSMPLLIVAIVKAKAFINS